MMEKRIKVKKGIKKALVMSLLAGCITMFAACGKDEAKEESKTVTYKVSVEDALGNKYTSGVIAKFMQNNEQVAMQVCDANGIATKELDRGDYDVEISFTSGDEGYSYKKEGLKVTADKPEITVVVAYTQSNEATPLYVDTKEYEAYSVNSGCTEVKLVDGRNYFLFTPTEAGTYEFSIAEGNVEAIGYYGAPHYVQSISAAEVKDNKFTVSVKASMISTGDTGTTVIVFGVDKADSDSCVLGVERIGDPQYGVEDEPWIIYEKTTQIKTYTLPVGSKLGEFDLTAASYDLVLNEEDGFYHLNSVDGPLVLVRLAKESKYLASFKTILENSGVVKYFYDEDGNFVKKENYADCLLEYIECADKESGTYPLTEDLKYIITQRGDHEGWWDIDSHSYLFIDQEGFKLKNINSEIAWLFMCCYIEE